MNKQENTVFNTFQLRIFPWVRKVCLSLQISSCITLFCWCWCPHMYTQSNLQMQAQKKAGKVLVMSVTSAALRWIQSLDSSKPREFKELLLSFSPHTLSCSTWDTWKWMNPEECISVKMLWRGWNLYVYLFNGNVGFGAVSVTGKGLFGAVLQLKTELLTHVRRTVGRFAALGGTC